MDQKAVQQVLENQVLTVAKAVEEKLDEEIDRFDVDRLDEDDLEQLRERRLQQMKKMAAKKQHWPLWVMESTRTFLQRKNSSPLPRQASALFAISTEKTGLARSWTSI